MAPRPSIVSWNLTRLCNERCQHCYLSAAPDADRSDELSTGECLAVLDQLQALAPGALIIFTGGEPLLREDITELVRAARERDLTVVVGTNGLRLTTERLAALRAAGLQGVGLSLDSLQSEVHDAFRGRRGAWHATVSTIERLREFGLPFVLQTTVSRANLGEIPDLLAFAAAHGAQAHNLYFLVPTGRGQTFSSDISPHEYEVLLDALRDWYGRLAAARTGETGTGPGGRLILGVKCAPHYQRVLWQHDRHSPHLRHFDDGAGGCPAGVHYLGIRPNGDVTPCPYLPIYGGNVRRQPLAAIWHESRPFQRLRQRDLLDGRCKGCEFRLLCGGCRARAYAVTGDALGEDPWCAYEPGAYGGTLVTIDGADVYAAQPDGALAWAADAQRLLDVIPAFVRGLVRRRVERYASERGCTVVTSEVMRQARRDRVPRA
ncbi:MAG: radical SAM protein [Chloroflexi bacterium]|nr:radical SAM protein [Chloroflexota bacterium]MBI4506339.1 radical SAM protein [Chloroflexota bacterium]